MTGKNRNRRKNRKTKRWFKGGVSRVAPLAPAQRRIGRKQKEWGGKKLATGYCPCVVEKKSVGGVRKVSHKGGGGGVQIMDPATKSKKLVGSQVTGYPFHRKKKI